MHATSVVTWLCNALACHPDMLEPCTHRGLSYNLFSKTNTGHFLLDDLLNLIYYKPEQICNVGHPNMLDVLDYTPQTILKEPCNEGDFLYYGFYQTQNLNYGGVKNRIRIAHHTEGDLHFLWSFLDNAFQKHCPNAKGQNNGVLHIRRHPRFGRAVPNTVVLPKGATQIKVDVATNTTMQWLCKIAAHSVVVAPWGSELALPVVAGVPFVALMNDYVDAFYYQAIISKGVHFASMYMNSTPNPRKPHHPYYNQFKPTPEQLKHLAHLVSQPPAEWPAHISAKFPIRQDRTGILHAIRESRKRYLLSSVKGF